ncbi:MAG: D-alanine--D-alanine ligase [Clostridia bacterium]|nr:D-alanine--D-alanine ligase [Clostridia bacterium]
MKIRVGLFFGGNSVEHEISVITALQAAEYIDREKYEIVPVYITKDNRFFTGAEIGRIENYKNIPELLKKSDRVVLVKGERGAVDLVRYPAKKFGGNLLAQIDVALPAVHGTNCEDGTLQGFLTLLDLPYAGCDVYASALGMDKYAMKAVLAYNHIPVLDGRLSLSADYNRTPDREMDALEKAIGYPMIVKPYNLGSSIGIMKARDRAELKKALENAFIYAQTVLVERAIMNLKEINCAVLGDRTGAEASECEQPVQGDDILSFEDKYIGGAKGAKGSAGGSKGMASLKRKIPADISAETRAEIRELAVKAFRCLGCAGVARIDFMIDMDDGKVYLNEINTIPGSLSFYLWEPLGVSYRELLDKVISLAVRRSAQSKNIVHSFDSNVLSGVSFKGSKGSKR